MALFHQPFRNFLRRSLKNRSVSETFPFDRLFFEGHIKRFIPINASQSSTINRKYSLTRDFVSIEIYYHQIEFIDAVDDDQNMLFYYHSDAARKRLKAQVENCLLNFEKPP